MSNSITYLGRTYNDDEIVSGSFSQTQSLNMAELSVDTANITVRPNPHRDFFTHDPLPFATADRLRFQTSEANVLSGRFEQNSPIVQKKDGSQTAIWYVESIERQGKDIYRLNAISSLGRLSQMTHYGGIYDGVSASVVVADICGDIPYFIGAVFENVLLYGWLPIASARDNLQQVLFALNANLSTSSDGVLRIDNLSAATSAIIGEQNIYSDNASVKYDKPVTKVVVLEHQYVEGQEVKQLYESSTASVEDITVTFSEPIHDLVWSGGMLTTYGANYAVIPSGTTGTLTGETYIHRTREVQREVTQANVPNIIRVESATLVGLTASASVAERLANYYAHRNRINISVANLPVQAGYVVDVFDPYDGNVVSACIETNQESLSATSKSSISALVGASPWQVEPFEDVRELLTDSGTFIVPDGVTQITAVLIGGGGGGDDGTDGEDGEVHSINRTFYRPGTISCENGAGGAGGSGGRAGASGKILRIDLTVTPGDALSYSAGAAGVRGVVGTPGGETTLLNVATSINYSTADGAAWPDGYTDPTTGEIYAVPGTNGIGGGRGGDGGAATGADGNNGGDGYGAGVHEGGHGGVGRWHKDSIDGSWTLSNGGGGGGGASAYANGSNGTDGEEYSIDYGGDGGDGADALDEIDAVGYGSGGNGGNGGGGGGGTGGQYYTTINSGTPVTWNFNPVAGKGGKRGLAGNGAEGCVALYFRRPVSV